MIAERRMRWCIHLSQGNGAGVRRSLQVCRKIRTEPSYRGAVIVCAKGQRMTKLSIRRMWTMYADSMLSDNTIASSEGGRMFTRTIAHGAF
jgi:hypothetical protein